MIKIYTIQLKNILSGDVNDKGKGEVVPVLLTGAVEV
jgi:hypothetical protein